MTSQGQERRFTDDFRCPVCGGCDTDPRGQDQRCFGYATADWVYCTREEHANGAPFDDKKKAYYHKARGNCKCGVEHAPDNEPARKPRRGRLVVVAEYPYLDAANNENFKVLRFVDESTGEKTFRQTHWDRQLGKYARGRGPAPLILYKLDMLAKAPAEAVVWIVEGEKDVNRLNKLGLLATCNPMGAGKWKDFFSNSLADRTCVILPDNDQTGKDHAKDVARSLQKTAKSVKILDLPGLPEKGDVSDWLNAGKDNTVARLRELANSAPELIGVDLGPPPKKEKADPKKGAAKIAPAPFSQADVLMKIAERATLWRTENDEAYASVPGRSGSIEHLSITGAKFADWLMWSYHQDNKNAIQAEAINTARWNLAARARFDGQTEKTWLRVAEGNEDANGPAWWVDLGDDEGRAVRITTKGWEVVQGPPIKFLRPGITRPLPVPERGGSIDELWEFVNVKESDRPLVVATLAAYLKPTGPYPMLILNGEQGSAKSTTNKVLKHLVDPRAPELGSMPESDRDIMVATRSNWLLGYDNMSSLTKGRSNTLCRILTGGGMELRKLHTDDEVIVIEAMRPIIVNGIEDFARAADLLDRSVLLNLPIMPGTKIRDPDELWPAFLRARPRILGALYDAMARGLAIRPGVKPKSLPRMAGFAVWGESVCRALGYADGEFLSTYLANRDASSRTTIEDSPVADALFELHRFCPDSRWDGTFKELLEELRSKLTPGIPPGPSWPNTPKGLATHLRRIAQALRVAGIDIAFTGETKRGRTILVTWSDDESDPTPQNKAAVSPPCPPGEKPPFPGWTQNQRGEWVPY